MKTFTARELVVECGMESHIVGWLRLPPHDKTIDIDKLKRKNNE